MNQSFGALKRVFDLINKTGDRCIILSPDSDEAYAVMSLAAYERLVLGKSDVTALTEDELLDKINRDIAIWKSQQEADKDESPDWGEKPDNYEEDDFEDFEEEDPYYFEKV